MLASPACADGVWNGPPYHGALVPGRDFSSPRDCCTVACSRHCVPILAAGGPF